MYSEYDKENIIDSISGFHNSQDLKASKGFKKADLSNKKSIAGRFGQLLTNATNEIREEEDTLYAIDSQAEEAVTLLSEWLQESQDLAMAQELASALVQERDCQRRLEIIQGEAEALRVAVEEKRRIKSEALAKIEREKADEAFAKSLAEEEVKYVSDFKQQYEDDEKYCLELEQEEKKLYGSRSPIMSESKHDGNIVIPDDGDDEDVKASPPLKQSSYGSEEKISSGRNKYYSSDDKDGGSASNSRRPSLSRPPSVNQMEEKLSSSVTAEENSRQKKRSSRSLAQKLKFDDLPSTSQYKKYNFSSMKDETVISKIWEKTTVDIQELDEALVLIIQLPNIQKLHIGLENQGKIMKIDAKRYVRGAKDSNNGNGSGKSSSFMNLLSKDSTTYNAELVLDGDIHVTTKDIYHEYYQELGVLFIYIENICLDKENEEKVSGKSGMVGKGKHLLGSMKNNFLRIFGK